MTQVTEQQVFASSRNQTVHGFDCRYNNYNRLLKVNGVRILDICDNGEEASTVFTVDHKAIESLGLSLTKQITSTDKVLGFVLEGTQGFQDWRGFGSDSRPEKFYVVVK